jgi:hypothetical protein
MEPKAHAVQHHPLALRIAGGAAIRPPAIDLLGEFAIGARISGPWCAEAGIGLVPSAGPGLRILEVTPTLAASVELLANANWELVVAARAGLLLHSYSFSNTAISSRSGVATDTVFALPLRASRRVFPWLWLDLAIAPGLATRSRTHILDGETLWHRNPGQLQLTTGLTVVP